RTASPRRTSRREGRNPEREIVSSRRSTGAPVGTSTSAARARPTGFMRPLLPVSAPRVVAPPVATAAVGAVLAAGPMVVVTPVAFLGTTAVTTLASALGRGAALGLLDERLARQADLAGGVDAHDLDQDLVAFLDLGAHVLHAVVRHLRDVEQAVGA